jgi:CheY-like chemotaxis protein
LRHRQNGGAAVRVWQFLRNLDAARGVKAEGRAQFGRRHYAGPNCRIIRQCKAVLPHMVPGQRLPSCGRRSADPETFCSIADLDRLALVSAMARVLIVEDEEQVRVLAESYLREQGHRTLSAASPVEALAALGVADGIDLLFADIGLREDPHGGLDLAKEARRRKPDLKVLYVTGQAVTDGMKAMMVDRSALLEKPYTVEQLQTALTVHFGIKPKATPTATSATPTATP